MHGECALTKQFKPVSRSLPVPRTKPFRFVAVLEAYSHGEENAQKKGKNEHKAQHKGQRGGA